MSNEVKFPIGPPSASFGGMATSYRRQQIPETHFWKLRNLRLSGEALERRKGIVRLCCGARKAESLSLDGTNTTFITVPISDGSVDLGDFTLGGKFTIFASYRVDDIGDDVLVACSDTEEVTPGYMIRHNDDGTITAIVTDSAATTVTLTTAASYDTTGVEYAVQLVRDGANTTLNVDGVSAATNSGLGASTTTKAATAVYIGGYTGRATGSEATFYELRIHREAITSDEWRVTQYPWGGRFGDPNLALFLTFEDGSGTSITDWSRNNHSAVAISGAGSSWNGGTVRQVTTPVTGIHVHETARGRKWVIADIGVNHYRIAIN